MATTRIAERDGFRARFLRACRRGVRGLAIAGAVRPPCGRSRTEGDGAYFLNAAAMPQRRAFLSPLPISLWQPKHTEAVLPTTFRAPAS